MAVVIKIISTEEVVHYKYSAKVFNMRSKISQTVRITSSQ